MKKLCCLMLLCALILTSLLSCSPTAEDTPQETQNTTETQTTEAPPALKYSDFLIIRPDNASQAVRQAAVSLRNTIFDVCGMTPGLTTDITKETSDYEIVIGNTREGAEEALAAHADAQWILQAEVQGEVTRLYVNGKDEKSLLYAIRRLKEIIAAEEASSLLTLQENGKYVMLAPANISFYGDSITTFYNVTNNPSYNSSLSGQPVFYTEDRRVKMEETWWHRVMSALDLELCVNNAYSGDWCGSEHAPDRAKNLHNNKGDVPDMIVVYFGINDYNKRVAPINFKSDYKAVIKNMQETYPEANIFCCTLMPTNRTAVSADELDCLLAFNQKIREVAEELGVNLVDLYPQVEAILMADIRNGSSTKAYFVANDGGLHPNGDGFAIMAEGIVKEIQKWMSTVEFFDPTKA